MWKIVEKYRREFAISVPRDIFATTPPFKIGELTIDAGSLKYDLPAGSEVEILLEIDTSQNINGSRQMSRDQIYVNLITSNES
jgi:hypothetical protein